MRREWIEISDYIKSIDYSKSPSMRREWIEIIKLITSMYKLIRSPSMRREWIEITSTKSPARVVSSLPPCGGSGLKCKKPFVLTIVLMVSLHAEGVD